MIRPATMADMEQMIPIINAAFSIEEFIDGTRTDPERLPPMFDTGDFIVLEENGRIIASVYVEVRDDQRNYFGMLSVDPTQQCRGLGRKMVEAAENFRRKKRSDDKDNHNDNLRTE